MCPYTSHETGPLHYSVSHVTIKRYNVARNFDNHTTRETFLYAVEHRLKQNSKNYKAKRPILASIISMKLWYN